jgi:hypothetical protein
MILTCTKKRKTRCSTREVAIPITKMRMKKEIEAEPSEETIDQYILI